MKPLLLDWNHYWNLKPTLPAQETHFTEIHRNLCLLVLLFPPVYSVHNYSWKFLTTNHTLMKQLCITTLKKNLQTLIIRAFVFDHLTVI